MNIVLTERERDAVHGLLRLRQMQYQLKVADGALPAILVEHAALINELTARFAPPKQRRTKGNA